jgi:hypothetical protein
MFLDLAPEYFSAKTAEERPTPIGQSLLNYL